jgi:preprotein translocase subunit SecD
MKHKNNNKVTINFRIILFVIATILSLVFSLPSFLQTKDGNKIALGLDLQGGLYMLLGVKSEEAVKSKMKSIASSIKYTATKKDFLMANFHLKDESLSFDMYDKDEMQIIEDNIKKIKGLTISKTNLSLSVSFTEAEIEAIKAFAVMQAVDTIRNRLDQFGLAEPSVSRQGKNKIAVELPGIKTREQEARAKDLISRPANLALMSVDEGRSGLVNSITNQEASQYGDIILEASDSSGVKYLLSEIPILDGSKLIDARISFDEQNQVVIGFTLDNEGANIFGDFTAKNVGNRLAVVLDDKVYSAPVIRERIGGGRGQISGNFTPEEATNIAIALRSGSLLAPVFLEEKRSVGPSLGADSIKASMIALLSGFMAVIVFMILYYGVAGVISVVALLVNILIIVSVMAFFGATLTLPGMAGIVLTIGMAVDANVIINERIRELLMSGEKIGKAIKNGYKNATRAILDANITTLLVAVILYAYGTGTIKGFAITISIGIIASMFTAIFCTRGVYDTLKDIIKTDKKIWFGA